MNEINARHRHIKLKRHTNQIKGAVVFYDAGWLAYLLPRSICLVCVVWYAWR